MGVTVIIPAASARLTTVENVATDLGLALGSGRDAQIDRFIDQASRRAASFCRRVFGRETVRERFGCGFDIMLDRAPVVEIVSVAIDGTSIASDAYDLDGPRLNYLADGRRCGWVGRSIVVDYRAGWLLPGEDRGDPPTTTAPDLPADVERAAILLVAAAMSASDRDMMVKSEEVDGVSSTSWYVQGASAALPHPEAESILAGYRRLLFA